MDPYRDQRVEETKEELIDLLEDHSRKLFLASVSGYILGCVMTASVFIFLAYMK